MSLKLRHHLDVSGSLDGISDQLRRGGKISWLSFTEFASEDKLDPLTCCPVFFQGNDFVVPTAALNWHHFPSIIIIISNWTRQIISCSHPCSWAFARTHTYTCTHTNANYPADTHSRVSRVFKEAQAVGCSYCEPGVRHRYLPATANLYSLTIGRTSFLWGLLLWCVVVAVVLRGIFQDCYSVSQWLWAVYFGGSGSKFNHSSVMSFQNQRSTRAGVDQMQLLTRSLLASFDSTAITRCICSCPVAESNSCQSTSRRARASAHKTVRLLVMSRGWVWFHSQPSVNQTAAPSQDSLKDETRCDVQAEWFIVFIPQL